MVRKRKIKKRKVIRRKRRVVIKTGTKQDTQRQQKLKKLIIENLGSVGKTKTMYEMMLEAGYAETTAREQSRTLAGIKHDREMLDVVEKLIQVRDAFINALGKKDPNKLDAGAIARILKDLNHDIELLSGRPTERPDAETSLDPEDRALLDKILQDNKK